MDSTQTLTDNSALAHFTPTQRDEIVLWVAGYVDKYHEGHVLKRLDEVEKRLERLEDSPKSFHRSKTCTYFVEQEASKYRYGRSIDDLNEELRVGFRKKSGMPAFIAKIMKWNSDGVLLFKGSNKRDIFDEFIFCYYDEGELSIEELKQRWEVFRKACVAWNPK
jgi:hypothetical protein